MNFRVARPAVARALVAVAVTALVVLAGGSTAQRVVSPAVTLVAKVKQSGPASAPPPHSSGKGPGTANGTFAIVGSVDGLFPGATETLALELANPHPFAIVVTDLAAVAGDAAPGCPADQLVASAFSGARTIPGNGTALQEITVRLAPDAPNACQAASFPLTFSGTAEKENGK